MIAQKKLQLVKEKCRWNKAFSFTPKIGKTFFACIDAGTHSAQ